MNNVNITTANVFRPDIWSQEVTRATQSKLVLADRVSRFDKVVGKSLTIPNISNLAANDKTANVKVSPQAPTETSIQLLFDKHKESSFVVEDMVAAQSNIDLMKEYLESASYAIAKAADSDVAALAATFSTEFGTYNTAITTDVLLDGIEALDLADVPEEDRHFAFRADVKRDLLDIATYTSRDFVSGEPVRTGAIGTLYGVETAMSNNLVKTGNNTNNMLFHKQAIAMGMQFDGRVQSAYDLEYLGWLTVVDALYGVIERRDDHGILIKT